MNPNFEWYSKESRSKGVTPRCPYAHPRKCNKYYSSIYLLGELGITTQIPSDIQVVLDDYWKESGLLPLIEEHDPSVTHTDNKLASVSNFCPEVSFNFYGLFATYMHRYVDEIDRGAMIKKLSREGGGEDWRCEWMSIRPLHYTECDNFSQLPYIKESKYLDEELIEMKPGLMGFSVNLKVLFRKVSGKASDKLLQRIKKIWRICLGEK
ncbi:hypothetical protein [Microbulbifer sp. MCCC 1A16149]|uniref:hypothetical protein n=1 Tax=Microbulbifer sp. MCCC 1A16149 TaxID=3411322 RepID=UPI003D0CEF8B